MHAPQPSPDGIMQLGLAFWGSKALLSAVELGLFTELARQPLDGEALRRRLGLHPRGAADFFDALVALGLLRRDGGVYANAAEAEAYLDRAKPTYIGGILEMANARLYGNWAKLTQALRSGQQQNEAEGAGDPFEAMYANPEVLRSFLQGMTGVSLPNAQALAQLFPWNEVGSFVDIGTAQGGLPVTLARAHPHLRGGGFDLPQVRPVFEAYVKEQGLAERLSFHEGNFLQGPLPSAEVLVMGHILHDWDLETKRMLLAKAHDALPRGGRLLVYDQMIDDGRREHAAGLLMSLNMLVETPGGFDYTGADCQGWLREAGFSAVTQRHLRGPYSLVTGTK